MKRTWLWVLIAAPVLCLALNFLSAQELFVANVSLHLQNGEMVAGEMVDISSTRLVVRLRDGREFPLHEIWMINFVGTDWNFPEERERLEKDEHYLFFKNDRLTSGRIVDFNRRVFELDTKENVPVAQVRRIYFTNRLPSAYQSRLAEQKPNFVGTFSGDATLSTGVSRKVTLTLNPDKTALLTQLDPRGQAPVAEQGTWFINDDGTITVRTSRPGQIRRLRTVPLVFRLENDELITVSFDRNIWGSAGVRLKRT
jgi:hypothetical protein